MKNWDVGRKQITPKFSYIFLIEIKKLSINAHTMIKKYSNIESISTFND